MPNEGGGSLARDVERVRVERCVVTEGFRKVRPVHRGLFRVNTYRRPLTYGVVTWPFLATALRGIIVAGVPSGSGINVKLILAHVSY